MKTFILAVIFVTIVALLRLNLPPAAINGHVLSSGSNDIVEELSRQVLFSNTVADWQYRDFILLRYACSDRLKISLVGLPFSKWRIDKTGIASCDSALPFF